jgi:hypothetical protein
MRFSVHFWEVTKSSCRILLGLPPSLYSIIIAFSIGHYILDHVVWIFATGNTSTLPRQAPILGFYEALSG